MDKERRPPEITFELCLGVPSLINLDGGSIFLLDDELNFLEEGQLGVARGASGYQNNSFHAATHHVTWLL